MEQCIGEERIHYSRRGEGKTVLLLHGNMSSGKFFQKTMEEVEGFDFIAPDMRGFGDSTYRHPSKDIADYVHDMKALIVEKNLSDFHLCGWSFGGGVVLRLLEDEEVAERVDKVVLLSSMGANGLTLPHKKMTGSKPFFSGQNMWTDKFWKKGMEMSSKFFAEFVEPFEEMAAAYRFLPEHLQEQWLEKIFLSYMYTEKKPSKKEWERNLKAAAKQRNFMEVRSMIETFQLNTKSLPKKEYYVLHGGKDRVIDVEVAKDLARAIKGKFILFHGCGHSIFTDNFPAWKKFLETLR